MPAEESLALPVHDAHSPCYPTEGPGARWAAGGPPFSPVGVRPARSPSTCKPRAHGGSVATRCQAWRGHPGGHSSAQTDRARDAGARRWRERQASRLASVLASDSRPLSGAAVTGLSLRLWMDVRLVSRRAWLWKQLL